MFLVVAAVSLYVHLSEGLFLLGKIKYHKQTSFKPLLTESRVTVSRLSFCLSHEVKFMQKQQRAEQ